MEGCKIGRRCAAQTFNLMPRIEKMLAIKRKDYNKFIGIEEADDRTEGKGVLC